MARLLVGLDQLAAAGPIEISTQLLCSWHGEIFGDLFPDYAGRLRGMRHSQAEHVYFGMPDRGYRGTSPRQLPRRISKICDDFNIAAAKISACGDVTGYTFDAVHAATQLYAKALRAHPLVDGNLRAMFVALNAGLATLGLDTVAFDDLELHDQLLAIAFHGKNDSYRPLAEHIAGIIDRTDSA